MIINLSKRRKDYFADLTTAEILRQYINKDGPITINDLKKIKERIVVGTREGDLEKLLSNNYAVNSLELADKIDHLTDEQLLVLPPDYRIDAAESRQVLVYDLDTLVRLDSIEVKRAVLGRKYVLPGKLSAMQKRKAQWSPEKVVSAAFNLLYENREEKAERKFAGYSWFGKDSHRRIVSLYRAIQGAEIRAFQDYIAFKLLIPVFKKEIQLGKSAKSRYKEELSPEQIRRREEKIKKYEAYIQRKRKEGQPLKSYLQRMQGFFSDLIEPMAIPFAHRGGRLMRVPSRSRPGITYKIQLTGIPLLPPEDERAYSLVWDLRGECICEDKLYRSDRRRKAIDCGQDEDFFCPHEIAALHSLKHQYQNKNKERIHFLPFVIPTAEMMAYLERLRTQTILLTYNPEKQRFSKRALNHTESENLLWKRVLAKGCEASFTTSIEKFKEQNYDPHLDLIGFK